MKKLVIAIDCDDVLVNATEYLVATYNRMYGTSVQLPHAHMSRNEEWQAKRDVVLNRLHSIQSTDEYAAIEPDMAVREVVKRLAVQHELHVVSARSEEILHVTERMLDSYFPGCFAGIEHVGPDRSKGDVCAQLGASILIDDNMRHLLDAQSKGTPKLVWFGQYPWQENEELAAGIDRCADWLEVEQVIHEFADERL